jgi:hypothetical protein
MQPARGYPRESSPRHHQRSTHAWTITSTHSMPSEEIRRGVSSTAAERRFPEWDLATDLLAEEAARGEHFTQGGGGKVRQGQPESPGDGEAIRASQEPECGEKRRVRERGWAGSVWPTQTRAGLGQPAGWAGMGRWAKAHLYIWTKFKISNSDLKFWFKFKLKSTLLHLNHLN